MDRCQCQGVVNVFDKRYVARELKSYQRHGADKTTRVLVSAIADAMGHDGLAGTSVLDIGGGIGAIQYELLAAGAGTATSVDASPEYVEAATAESARRGYAERITHRFANFVDVAPEVPPADIVTMERVICCFHDMPGLVGPSAARAQRLYGLVFPRDTWWMRTGGTVMNAVFRVTRNSFRFFVHPTAAVDAVAREKGLRRHFGQQVGVWQVVVYARE